MSESLIPSFLVSNVSELLRLLIKNEWCEWIAQVAQQKWVTMSDSLTSLRGNEQSWANHSGRSPKMIEWVNCLYFWVNRSFAHFWAKSEQFARKTDERSPSPIILYGSIPSEFYPGIRYSFTLLPRYKIFLLIFTPV